MADTPVVHVKFSPEQLAALAKIVERAEKFNHHESAMEKSVATIVTDLAAKHPVKP